jgi:hypothetical protein
MVHVLVFIFARPHDLALPERSNVSYGRDDPHDHQQHGERTTYPIDSWARVCVTELDSGQAETCIRKHELVEKS